MADISKCKGENCPIRETCYRYIAKSNPYAQAWSIFEYKDGCNDYLHVEQQPKPNT